MEADAAKRNVVCMSQTREVGSGFEIHSN